MHALICGSIAYDTIMVFPDQFKRHILPEQIHILNISFLVPEMRREFGGCAGNIAYNLKLLGDAPLIMATVGEDAGPYLERLDQLGLPRTHVRQIPGSFTAQAFIINDLDDNQINAFHPGAMNSAHHNHVREAGDVALAIVAPDGREGMLQHVRDLSEAGIPFIFDPGQGLPMFTGEELRDCLLRADYAAFNDYEARLACERTGLRLAELAGLVRALIVTKGAQGSEIHSEGRIFDIPAVPASAVLDPTGCGDAYRAGLIHGILAGWDWPRTGRLAALMGAIKIASRGPQNHAPSRAEIGERYFRVFNERLW